jgi:DNA polymerase-3 subunit delta'
VSFILLLSSKATLLPTIRSRLPVYVARESREVLVFELDMERLDLASVYDFVQKHKRLTDKTEAKALVEKIGTEAMRTQRYELDEQTLQLFHNAFRALDVGSQPQFVLTVLLLKLLARKKKV